MNADYADFKFTEIGTQLVNYLKATGVEVGLIINFGRSVQVRRRVFQPDHQRHAPNPHPHPGKAKNLRNLRQSASKTP